MWRFITFYTLNCNKHAIYGPIIIGLFLYKKTYKFYNIIKDCAGDKNMKKFTLLFITIFSVILLTSCINIDLGGTKTPTPTVDTTPTPVTEYTVTFMNGDKVHKTYTIQEGSKVNKPTDPTKEGFNFIGWSTNENVKNDFDFDKPITSNITVYACFERIVEKNQHQKLLLTA